MSEYLKNKTQVPKHKFKNVSPLIQNLLKVRATDYRKIQEEIKRNLESLGYEVKLEKKIWTGREGKIDVFAQKGNYSIGILNELKQSILAKAFKGGL